MPGIMISDGEKRILPRKFAFHWGGGQIIEEVFVKCTLKSGGITESWEPTIQALQYDDKSIVLRFCVYNGKRLTRMPPLMDQQILRELAKRAEKAKLLRELLSTFNFNR
jgi:hypothetical protein